MSDNGLDPFYYACLYFRFNQIQLCLEKCDLVLQQSPLDQAAWSLKLACLAEEVLVDELENEEIGLAEMYMNENIIAQNARPGTSFSRPKTSTDGNDQLIRPRTAGGRPITGVVRPLTMGKASQMEKTLKSSRTAKTSRPISSSSIRQIRQGTASMIASSDGPFLNLARLNIDKYAADNHVNRYLFDYVFYTIGDMKSAHQIAAVATKANNFEDWFWKNQLGKCYYRLNMYKDAEKQFLSSLKNKKHIETFAYLAKVYSRLDQPNTAFEILNEGIFFFDQNVTLMLHKARIEEQMENMDKSIAIYKDILKLDANNIEAIACIATTLFYNDQPEIALGYYRRILQMGVNTPALYMNLGICCFASQQIDLCFPCIEKALAQAPDNEKADFWYNTGTISLLNGDQKSASRCFRLSVTFNPDHAESLTNLGTIRMLQRKFNNAKSLFRSAIQKSDHLFEPHYNMAICCFYTGQYVESVEHCKSSLKIYPAHIYSQDLIKEISSMIKSI